MLYVVRHGIAAELGENGVSRDAERPLTDRGKKRTEQVAMGLARLGVKPARILASPLVRAMQTAEILQRALAAKVTLETSEHMLSGAVPETTVEWLASEETHETMLVGHMPHLAYLTSLLLTGDTAAAAIVFKKAAVCCLSFDAQVTAAGGGCLEWLLQPEHLRELGKEAR